jgi:uncharacterized protein (DUF302 family)
MNAYGRRVTVNMPFDVANDELLNALQDRGVARLGHTDVDDFLTRTVHHDFRRYAWFEVAIPDVVLDALRDDLCVGAVLPTTIALFEVADGQTVVVVSEPFAALGSDAGWRREHPRLAALADRTCDRLGRVLMDLERASRTFTAWHSAA